MVIRVALWIIGEYAVTQEEVTKGYSTIKKNIGSLPIYPKSSLYEENISEKKEGEE